MSKKFWAFAFAFLFISSLAVIAEAQSDNSNGQSPPGQSRERAKNRVGQGENPGNGNQGENPGNGNQGDNPGNGNQGENPGNDGQNDEPSHGTPDGLTPSQEDSCDGLKGGTPGLYGLCVAFCEAHDSDCVPDYSLENPYRDCRKRDRKILEKYRQKMRDGDPDMPCLPSANENPEFACPCWNQDDLALFPFQLSGWPSTGGWLYCELDSDWSVWDDETEELECEQYGSYIGESSSLPDGNEFHVDLLVTTGECDGMYCTGFVGCMGDTCPPELIGRGEFILDVTEEEYANCKAALEQLSATYCN